MDAMFAGQVAEEVGRRLGREVTPREITRTWDEVEAFAATGMGPTVAVSPDGRYVALGGAGGVVRAWDRRDRTELPPLSALSEKPPGEPTHFHPEVTRLAFGPDGETLAGVSGGTHLVSGLRHVALWRWPAGALAHKLPLTTYDPWTLAFTPDGRHLLATANVRSVVWDVATGAVRGEREQDRHGSSYGPVAVAPDGRRLYTLGAGSLLPVSLPDLTPIAPDPPLPGGPPAPPFETYRHPAPTRADGPGWRLPDGTRIRQGGITRSDETFGVLHLDAGGRRIRYYLERNVVGFDVAADGKLLATYGHDDTPGRGRELPLQFWDLATGAELAAVPVSPPLPYSYLLRFSPDGKRLAMLHGRDLVRVYDVAGRAPVLSLDTDGVAVSELTYSADGRFLVGSRGSGPAVVWDATGGE